MRSRIKNRSAEVELDITAFLNLMVVLIPFLLLNAVFAQVSILQLNLPANDDSPAPPDEDKPPFVLEVLIYKNRYEIVDRNTGPLKIVPNTDSGEHDMVALDAFLARLKGSSDKAKEVSSATILCEDDTPYSLLIQTMDTVRLTRVTVNGQTISKELFPDVGIGVAPPDTAAVETEAAGGKS